MAFPRPFNVLDIAYCRLKAFCQTEITYLTPFFQCQRNIFHGMFGKPFADTKILRESAGTSYDVVKSLLLHSRVLLCVRLSNRVRPLGSVFWGGLPPGRAIKSSVSKFYSEDDLRAWTDRAGAQPGDLMLILAGPTMKTRKQLCELRLEMGSRLGLRDPQKFSCLWVVDFPLFEWDDETQRYYAMHHPFTAPNPDDIHLLDSDTGAVRATAYDMVVNGNELGGGSIRIHEATLQDKMFRLLGLSEEDAQYKFGFLMNAFKYGAPPHGGLAFGFDRFVSILAGLDSIRDVIAFPKNNSGRDMMIDAPASIDDTQLDELQIKLDLKEKE